MPKPNSAPTRMIPWSDLVKVQKLGDETIFSIDISNIADRPELVPPALSEPIILQDSELVIAEKYAFDFSLRRRPEEIANSSTPIWNAFIERLKAELDPEIVSFLKEVGQERVDAYNLIATDDQLRSMMKDAPILLQAGLLAVHEHFVSPAELTIFADLPVVEFTDALRNRFYSSKGRSSESPLGRRARGLRVSAWVQTADLSDTIWRFKEFEKIASFLEDQNLDRVRNFPKDFYPLLYEAIELDHRLATFFVNGPMNLKSALLRNMPNTFIEEIDTDAEPELLTLHRLAVYLEHCDEARLPVPNGVKPLGSKAREYFLDLEREEEVHSVAVLEMMPRISGMTFPSAIFKTKPVFVFEGENFTLRPLLSADSLLREGIENENCIKEPKFALRCSTGYRYFYSVMPESGERMRASLEVSASGSIIGVEFKDNKKVTPEFRAAIVEFLRENWTDKFTPSIFMDPVIEASESGLILEL